MKLISTTDLLLNFEKKVIAYGDTAVRYEQKTGFIQNVFKYVNFLKTPVNLSMFIPCDKFYNPIENPTERQKNKVLFKGIFTIHHNRVNGLDREIFLLASFKVNENLDRDQIFPLGWFQNGFLEDIKIENLIKYNFSLRKPLF